MSTGNNSFTDHGFHVKHIKVEGKISTSEVDADNEADARKCEAMLPGIKVLWAVLEEYVKNGQVNQLGVADVGGGCLYKLHAWAKVKPAIAQINLASCCVVPPSLHAFCRANDVQLLTHADPPDLLSLAAVKTLSDAGVGCNNLDWCARYQVHIKCRGVLALKGYVCKATLGKEGKIILEPLASNKIGDALVIIPITTPGANVVDGAFFVQRDNNNNNNVNKDLAE
ncbi:hypothetical protein MSG28_010173 [Choristoneura fumiferana]|uniref:Uncharacterized protein n=1 Tax=Choristoneura fumiferana TaxID=7141 RepID=A0ACC0KK78_CHOFU|nr:hypothetical protein MSG28_010173 [Choristoneura fumiferana]